MDNKVESEREIQVAGNACFNGKKWQGALEYFLDGVQTRSPHVMYRPKIYFSDMSEKNGCVIRLDGGRYVLGDDCQGVDDVIPDFQDFTVFESGPDACGVEHGLRALAKGEITMLVIGFNKRERLYLWEKGFEFGCVVRRDPWPN